MLKYIIDFYIFCGKFVFFPLRKTHDHDAKMAVGYLLQVYSSCSPSLVLLDFVDLYGEYRVMFCLFGFFFF